MRWVATKSAAKLAGIKVWQILMFVYCASGLLAGLGGVMSSTRLLAANGLQLDNPTNWMRSRPSSWAEPASWAASNDLGTLIGAPIIAVLSNGLILTERLDVWQFIIKGLSSSAQLRLTVIAQ